MVRIALAIAIALASFCGVQQVAQAEPACSVNASAKPFFDNGAYHSGFAPWSCRHAKTFMIPSSSPTQYNATFGWTTWANIAQFIDMSEASASGYQTNATNGGITSLGYLDVNSCTGNFTGHANAYASIDCSTLPASAFYQDSGSHVVTWQNGNELVEFADPSSSSLQSAAASAAATQVSNGPIKYLMFDDSGSLDEMSYHPYCGGVGTWSGSTYSCTGAPGGTLSSPYAANYTVAQWQAGEAALAAAMPVPVLLNGLGQYTGGETTSAVTSVVVSTPNVFAGMCDGCYYGFGASANSAWTGAVLTSALNSSMAVANARKAVVNINYSVTDVTQRQRALADIMLAYRPDYTYEYGGECGATSLIPVCPEQSLTFHSPLKSFPTSVASVTQTGGAYAREFGACFAGTVNVGPCAAVVNPSNSATATMPTLSQTYAHTLVITGLSLCGCYGDAQGSVAENGAAAPSTLPAASGYVLFQ